MTALAPELTRKAKAVVAQLVDLEPRPTNHGPGWLVTVERRIRTERWPDVCALVAAQPDADPEDLAAQLAHAPVASPPAGGIFQAQPTPPVLEVWTGPELDPTAGPIVNDPTEKLNAARELLARTRKPPLGPPPVPTRGAVA
jgi:hypothetical protein